MPSGYCEICGEFIPIAAETVDDDGIHYFCHECSGEKRRLMPNYNRDKAWMHDREYHGEMMDGEW